MTSNCLSQAAGENILSARVGQLSLFSQIMLLPPGVPPMPALACFKSSYSEVWRVLTTTNVGNVTQGQWVPDHQMFCISDAQHFQAFCHLGGVLGGGGGDNLDVLEVRQGCAENFPTIAPNICWVATKRHLVAATRYQLHSDVQQSDVIIANPQEMRRGSQWRA